MKSYESSKVKTEMEVGKEMVIRSPEDAAKVTASFIGDEDREVFYHVLKYQNKVVAVMLAR